MKKQSSIYIALVIILTASLACNLGSPAPGSGGVTPTAILEPGSGGVTPTPPAIPEAGGTAPTVVPEPLPSGYTDLLQDKIASGEWTLEVGLVTLLKMFAGEIQVSEAGLGQGVLETEGTGILQLAGNYLQTGTDQAAKDEITRLLNIIVPSQEALDQYSIPEEQATSRTPGLPARAMKLAVPARQDLEECASFWDRGFPVRVLPSFPCFMFGKKIIAGNSHQVYYPLAWRGDESRYRYYRATLEAIQDSITEYQTYGGTVRPIYVVFSTLDYGGFDAYTFVHSFTVDAEACPIIIHPVAMTNNRPPAFKQLIAHEIFHCFQAWNLTDQLLGPGNDSEWWKEGTAEYFSNLVYDHVNSEHQYKNRFSNFSTTVPLTSMSYENFAFFQFIGNRIGPRGVIAMLRTMPTTPGLDAQLAALAAVPNMEATFDEFVRAVMDNTLEDTDTSVIEFLEAFTDQVYFTDIGSKDFSGQPFVVARYLVSFPGEKRFAVETRSEGVGRSAWRASESVGGWGPLLPATAIGECDELLYKLYVITTTPGAERTETIAASMVTELPCGGDECLIGRWEATNDSMLSYMQSVVSAGGDNVPTVESTSGIAFLDFDANGTGAGGYENFKVHETGVGGNEGSEVFVTFDGFSSGPYTADGSALIGLSGTTNILVTVKIPGVGSTTVPIRPEDFPVSSTISTAYSCNGDTLTTWPPADGVEPIEWIRTSP